MTSSPPHVQASTLRRSRSESHISVAELPRPQRLSLSRTSRRHDSWTGSTNAPTPTEVVGYEASTDVEHPPDPPPRRLWLPQPTVVEDRGRLVHVVIPPHEDASATQPNGPLSRLGRIWAFFGYGRGASRARKALVSLIWNLGWGLAQVIVIIAILVVAAHSRSPTNPLLNQWDACDRPLGVWSCLWVVRVCLACAVAFWGYLRDRRIHQADDAEANVTDGPANGTPGTTQRPSQYSSSSRSSSQTGRSGTNRNQNGPPLPYTRLFTRLTLFSSVITLTWFLTVHILQYTSLNTCRLSAPHIWWLTFSILCIMYIMVLEVVLLGLIVFIIAPIVFIFWNIFLICIGRHPIQHPTMIKPEIGKLPKSLVERIPLVIYIPPPPDELVQTPITIPEAVFSYPPNPPRPPVKERKARFAFIKRLGSRDGNKGVKNGSKQEKILEKGEPKTWEDYWEPGDYPFVRLEGNRAVCAICLMDFEEPKRVVELAPPSEKVQEETPSDKSIAIREEDGTTVQTQEIRVERQPDRDIEIRLRLADAGEGPQPLRLLQCGHAFHRTCLDPWLMDVSGRCPVCQRAVEIPEPSKRKRRGNGVRRTL